MYKQGERICKRNDVERQLFASTKARLAENRTELFALRRLRLGEGNGVW